MYDTTCVKRSLLIWTAAILLISFGIATIMLPARAYADQNDSTIIKPTVKKAMSYAKAKELASDARSGDFCFAQSGSGRCTIASVAMMVRRAAYIDGVSDWQFIDEASVCVDGWNDVGVKNEFTSSGYDIEYIDIEGTPEALRALLEEHPEGIAAYDSGLPHAVLLTDYDEKTDIFYCADPASHYSGSRIPVTDSWNGACHDSDQSNVISGFTSAWVIAK